MKATERAPRSAEPAAGGATHGATHDATHSAASGPHLARPQPAAGNLVLQALYASGALRAQLAVGAADDPLEAQADRMADAALAGKPAGCSCSAGEPPCPACQAAAAAGIRRKPRGRDAPAHPPAPLLGSGRALGAGERAAFESSYGADLSEVRIHDNPQAAGSAARLNARAFSLGTRIAFGAGEYQPHTAAGRHLLGHELAHVVQGHGGIRRQAGASQVGSSMTPADANASFAPPAETPASSMMGPAQVTHPAGFDPCAVDVRTLTNYQLLAEYSHALGVVNRGRGADGYFDYRNLQRRLIAERDRRVDLGHAWLATMPSALPPALFQIIDGPGGTFSVVRTTGAAVAGAPEGDSRRAPYMTQAQFDSFLGTHDVERVGADEYMMRTIGPSTSGTLAGLSMWPMRGGLRRSPFGSPFLRDPLGPGPSPVPDAVFAEGVNTIDAWAMPFEPGFGRTLARRLATGGSVPLDHPVSFDIDEPLPVGDRNASPARQVQRALDPQNRQLLDSITNRRTKGLGIDFRDIERGRTPLPEVSLADDPGAVFTRRFGEVTEMRTLFAEALAEIPDINALSPTQLKNTINTNMRDIIRTGRTPSGRAVRDALRAGGFEAVPNRGIVAVRPGMARVAGAEGMRGARVGGGLAVLGSAAFMLADAEEHPEWGQELAWSGALGSSSGYLGSATESLIYSAGLRSMESSLASTGTSSLTPGLLRGASRFGGGSVGAMFVEGISMGLLEEREHSGPEVGTRLFRSGGLGGASVWAGAAAGTAVGGPVGFIVGLAVGGALYYIGDKLVPGGREDWDAHEAGCTPLPTVSRWTGGAPGGFNSVMFNCFEAATPVRLADGSERRIADIAIGDAVLSYNEQLQRLQTCLVSAVHQAAPALMLRLQLENAPPVQVTPAHKLRTPHGWMPAGDLRPGDILWIASSAAGVPAVAGARLASVTAAAPAGPVYDLSVTGTHTYFAGGILAHNKLP
jgi:hypothetical protein